MDDSKRGTGAWLLAAVILVGVLASSANAQTPPGDRYRWLTCNVIWAVTDYRTGRNFAVKVAFREQPVSGVKVALTSTQPDDAGGYAVATATTNSDGVAHFFAVPPGRYIAHVDGGLLAKSRQLEVEAGNTAVDQVELEWPAAPIVTQTVRGQITSWQRATPQSRSERRPLQHVLVQMLEMRSGKLQARMYTSMDGYYEFSVPDGVYVLRVSQETDPSANEFDKAVEVASGATRAHMPRLEVGNACGGGLIELPDGADEGKAGALE